MAKLSKVETQNHMAALAVLAKDTLTEDEKDFVFENYHEAATNVNGLAGAFFTPPSLAWDAVLELGTNYKQQPLQIVDLCAGIGMLSYCALHRNPGSRVVCIEINPEYVEVGRKLVPEAEWHCIDVMDLEALRALGPFDAALSNPPFGRVATFSGKHGPRYSGGEAEYKVIEIAAEIARRGAFIIPQQSAPFKYSGVQCHEFNATEKYQRFAEQTAIQLDSNIGIDTSTYEGWKGVSPTVEVVCSDFDERELAPATKAIELQQSDLFAVAS